MRQSNSCSIALHKMTYDVIRFDDEGVAVHLASYTNEDDADAAYDSYCMLYPNAYIDVIERYS